MRTVQGPQDQTWAIAAGRARVGTEPVVVGPGELTPPAAVEELLVIEELGVGAVLPVLVSPVGRVLEAGACRVDGQLRSRGAGQDPDRASLRTRRDVDGTRFPWVAVRPEVVAGADLDPRQPGPQPVVDALIRRATDLGLRVVVDPTWRVVADDIQPEPSPARSTSASEVLVVTGFVPADRFRDEDHALQTLLLGLLANAEDVQVTLLAVDGYRAEPAAESLRRLGVEVVSGPVDLGSWLTERCARYSNVIVTWSGLQSNVRSWLQATQPQAVVTLYLTSRPDRDMEALRAYVPPDELSGLELVRAELEERLLDLGGWVNVLWCDRTDDAFSLRSSGRYLAVSAIPRGLAPWSTPAADSDGGAGIVVLATEGHDALKGNEEAALVALGQVLAPLRRQWPDLPCTVLTETPTPRLETTCREAGATTAPLREASRVLADARLVVVTHQHGIGGGAAIRAALESGAPFLATAVAAADVELGQLRQHAVCAGVEDVVLRARHLLGDPEAIAALRAAVTHFVAQQRRDDPRTAGIRTALPSIGLTPTVAPRPLWPAPAIPEPTRPPLVLTALRPDGWSGDGDDRPVATDDQDERYREWVRRFGPTPTTLASIEADLQTLEHRPLISILMPVHNTQPWMLKEAVRSVVDQLYPNWQLCIADDGSTRPETLAALEELAVGPSIQIVTLPGGHGIAGATNAALALADGEYVTFLDHDDVLKPHALAQVVRWINGDPSLDLIYSDEDKLDEEGQLVQPYLKPHWSPDLLRSNNYLCHLTTIRRSLVEKVGGLRPPFDGSQDFDLVLRVSELTDRIAHIPEPLYSWRITPGSAAGVADAKPYAIEASKRALEDSLDRRGVQGQVVELPWTGHFRTRYHRPGHPKVAIVIPTKDRLDLLKRCVDSVLLKTTYPNYELVLVDNQTTDGDALGYLASLPARVIRYPHVFNYARMINLAASSVEADALLFLNNDTEVITPEWVDALVEHAMRPEVGVVGGRLFFGDDQPQHEGVYVGVLGWATNMNHRGYGARGELVRNTSAITGACTMMRPSVYWRIGGNDERLRVAYNDVDLCLRVRQAGLEVVYTPHARLYHHESSSRSGFEHEEDGPLFGLRWEPRKRVDPYYSPLFLRDDAFRITLGEPDRAMPS